MGDSWALGEPERLGGGAGGGGALEPLEGGEAAGLDAAALLLREPHGLRRDLHGPTPALALGVAEAWGSLTRNDGRFRRWGERNTGSGERLDEGYIGPPSPCLIYAALGWAGLGPLATKPVF